MVGFRQKSTNHDGGFSTLPWSMQSAFKSVNKSWTENDSPFIFHHEKSQTPPPKLMMLQSGALQHLEEVKLIDDEKPEGIRVVSDLMSNAIFWCKYPPPKYGSYGCLAYHPQDIEDCRKDLKLLPMLLPGTI